MRMLSMRITIKNSNILANFLKNGNRSRSVFYGLVRPDMQKKRRRKSHAWAPLKWHFTEQNSTSEKIVNISVFDI
jgi:hypothetical protein